MRSRMSSGRISAAELRFNMKSLFGGTQCGLEQGDTPCRGGRLASAIGLVKAVTDRWGIHLQENILTRSSEMSYTRKAAMRLFAASRWLDYPAGKVRLGRK